jgi:hypothetical protein
MGSEEKTMAKIYQFHKSQTDTLWVPIIESSLVLGGSIAGTAAYFGLLPSVVPTCLPLQIVGSFAAWYLISASANAWRFLFQLNQELPSDETPTDSVPTSQKEDAR